MNRQETLREILRVLEFYDTCGITPRDAAQRILRLTGPENRPAVMAACEMRQELKDAVKQVVNDFKDLTDEQWDKVVTVEPGAYTRPFTPEEIAAREERHKEEHRQLRRGVDAMRDAV